MSRELRVAVVHPLLTQPLGDEGNADVLVARARRRGMTAEKIVIDGRLEAAADIYLLGGTPTRDQTTLVGLLAADPAFTDSVAGGAPVLGVNAGYEVLAASFQTGDGVESTGLGLLDVAMSRGQLVEGPIITRPGSDLDLPAMSGFESHDGRAELGQAAVPFAQLELGVGNGSGVHDGAASGHVIGTFIHGPILARNPELADTLISWAIGAELDPLPAGPSERLREYRIAEDRIDPTGWGGRKYGTAITWKTRLRSAFRSP